MLIVLANTVYAQTGKLTGKIVDKTSGETLIGLTVGIDGSTKGASTDIEGRYVIANLTPGKYSVTFRYLGYQTQTITDIEIKDGVATALNVVMQESAKQALNEVVVTATYRQASVGALYAQQKNAIAISDGISSDVIKKSPDKNTGEVLKRVSGASVQDNKFIIIRGLSDRYNTALINNTPLPSSEPDRKAFSFDIIPSALIDNVIISKTATADLPGDFAGGAIQVKTKDFPDAKVIELSYGAGYNSISTFKDFYGNSRNAKDYTTFGTGKYKLPSSFPATRAEYVNATLARQAELSKGFNNTWGINQLGTALPSQNLQFIYGNSYKLKNESKVGFITALTYRTSEDISVEKRNDFNEPDEDNVRLPLFRYDDNYYNFNSTLGLLANFAYIKGNSKIGFKNLFNRTFDDSYLQRNGVFDELEYRKVSQQKVTEKTLLNSVLEGDHLLSEKNKAKINWNLSFSRIEQNQPDLRRIFYSKSLASLNDDTVPFVASIPQVASASNAGRFFSELGENIYGASINYTLPFSWLKQQQIFKAGLIKQYKVRKVSSRTLGYRNSGNSDLLELPQGELFADENIAVNKFNIDDITNPDNKYDGYGDLNGAYALLSNSLTEKFKATYGLRVENYIEELRSADNSGAVNVDNNYLDILPSLNLTYMLSDKTNLRFSFSNTVARAQFRELAPFNFYDYITGNVLSGNPDLKRTKINNFDLRYEFYPSNGQIFSVSGFYKNFTDPIEYNVISGSTAASKGLTYVNAPEANIYGVEMEVRHDLGFFSSSPSVLKNLVFNANLTLIKSAVKFENAVTVNDDRPLQGQSPYLINAGFQYSSPKSGWQSSLLYNRIGRRISVVGFGQYTTVNGNREFREDYPDIYEAPRNILDFQIAKALMNKKAEIKLNVSNILNSEANFYQDADKNKTYEASKDQLINNVQYGRTFSLSFGYKF